MGSGKVRCITLVKVACPLNVELTGEAGLYLKEILFIRYLATGLI